MGEKARLQLEAALKKKLEATRREKARLFETTLKQKRVALKRKSTLNKQAIEQAIAGHMKQGTLKKRAVQVKDTAWDPVTLKEEGEIWQAASQRRASPNTFGHRHVGA